MGRLAEAAPPEGRRLGNDARQVRSRNPCRGELNMRLRPRDVRRISYYDPDQRQLLLEKVESFTEFPLLILAALMIPLLAGPLFWELTAQQESLFFTLDVMIWAIFAGEFAIRLAIAPRRVAFIRANWIDLVIVALPFFRPLRIVRLLVYTTRLVTGARQLLGVRHLLVHAVLLVMVAATVVTTVETGPNAQITSFPDALWWAIVTVTTVGYGDFVPVSSAGRAMGYILVLGGVGIFGALTANFASFLVREQTATDPITSQLLREIQALREELAERRGEE